MPNGITLAELHHIVQASMGWEDSHLHQFEDLDGTRYGSVAWGGSDLVDEEKVRLSQLLRKPGDIIAYEYDFGDSWVHAIELAAVQEYRKPRDGGLACIGGRGACPPEDCGGPFYYQEYCDALADPDAVADEEGFMPEGWDPYKFDVGEADKKLRSMLR